METGGIIADAWLILELTMAQTLITTPYPTLDQVARMMNISPEEARAIENMMFGPAKRTSGASSGRKPVKRNLTGVGVRKSLKSAH